MAFIVAVAVLSTVALEELARKRMQVALFVYSVAYVFLIAWAAMVLGMCAATEKSISGWAAIPNFQDWKNISVFHAISTLSVFEQSALVVMIAVAIVFALSCLATVYKVKRVVKKFHNTQPNEKLYIKNFNLSSMFGRNFAHKHKIYLCLCRFLN